MWHASSGSTPALLSRSPLRRWRVAASPVGRRPTHRLRFPSACASRRAVRLLFGARPPPPPHLPLWVVATVFSTFLAFASAPPRGRLSRALCCVCAADIRLCFAHLRSGVTVGAAQSAAGGTRPLRRRGWPWPTGGWNLQTLLAYPSRPPGVLQLIQKPEGHSAFLLFLFRLLVL